MAVTSKPRTGKGTDKVLHLVFAILLTATVISFTFWAIGVVGINSHFPILILTILFGSFMAFNIGGNDVANSFGTSVGAGTLSLKQALLIAAVFEIGGAMLAGGEVTDTVKSGIVDLDGISLNPMDFAYIMMSALVGAAVWLLLATLKGWPVSTTHSIVGGIVGAAVTTGFVASASRHPWQMVQWGEIGQIVLSWFISPLLGGLCAYFLFKTIKSSILRYNDQAEEKLSQIRAERNDCRRRNKEALSRMSEADRAEQTAAMARDTITMSGENYSLEDLESSYYQELYRINQRAESINSHRALIHGTPFLAALGAVIIAAMLLLKGLKNIGLDLTPMTTVIVLIMVGVTAWFAVHVFAKQLTSKPLDMATFIIFSWMQVFTAAAFAFSHGSNDIANAVGPFAAVLDVLHYNAIVAETQVPPFLMLTAGVALISGLWFIGRNVIHTVGTGLTKMHPASGFSAELSAAAVVMAASLLGLPVSSTHILIGAVLGIGVVNHSANWSLMKPIGMAWAITVPASALIGAVTVVIIRFFFAM
ncbi:inorganic phosphate transporter [Corynebacterium glucuronolyticum]|uniref:inorganic phosphate transporter n=1 Tax=Corynebacterium glucuronolyticum TaxID=39791 RepID=UPI00223BF718|nr:inorganic phosphate transporter [Corynebacterium glucuronolyticum]MCT1443540.1 inorganic phosphate transporter [Corynebacterium glucuronolyticum]MCT1563430.1 inorganic phosphate transporter [Corynebacterium glucuronolyticum]